MTNDGGLARWEVMQMTNTQRKTWIKQMTARAKAQKEAQENARGGTKGPAKLGR